MVYNMIKHRLLAFAVGICASIFGILYPEYVLLPEVYEYITVEEQDTCKEKIEENKDGTLAELIKAEPQQIQISSYFVEKWSDRGFVLWKNRN